MPRHAAQPDLTPEQVAEARALWEGGWSTVRVASRFGVSEPFLRKFCPFIHRRSIAAGTSSQRVAVRIAAGSRRHAARSHGDAR